jgi:hypothetical protein
MVCFGKNSKRVNLLYLTVVMLHSIKKCLFGADEGVLRNVVGYGLYEIDIEVFKFTLCHHLKISYYSFGFFSFVGIQEQFLIDL